MLQSTPYSRQNQLDRLNLKKFTQQLTNISITDAGLTNWEAKSLVEVVTELMEVNNLTTNQGQTVYSCVAITEPAGKPIKECSMIFRFFIEPANTSSGNCLLCISRVFAIILRK